MGSQFPSLIGRWAWQGPTSPAVGGALWGDLWLGRAQQSRAGLLLSHKLDQRQKLFWPRGTAGQP